MKWASVALNLIKLWKEYGISCQIVSFHKLGASADNDISKSANDPHYIQQVWVIHCK